MQEIVVGSRQKINLETWERRAAFHFFKNFTEPYHGVCLRVDCTATYRYAKQHDLSVFLSLLHRSLVAAHKLRISGHALSTTPSGATNRLMLAALSDARTAPLA